MHWWQRILNRTPKVNGGQSEFPVHFELIPGILTARVHLHEIDAQDGPVLCWSYVTDGLRTNKQKELIFTLRRGQGERAPDFPRDPLEFFTSVFQFAELGQLVDGGDITKFGARDFLGHKGLAYLRSGWFKRSFDDVEAPTPSLVAILLTDEEVDAAMAGGVTRVMARLGRAYRHYPCPQWSDRTRTGLPMRKTMEESILARVARMRGPGTRVRLEGDQIALRLLPRAAPHLQNQLKQLRSNAAVALLTDLDPTADGCLVWEPGQTAPEAITPPNSSGARLSGCFLAFVPEQTDDGGQPFEDGLVMMLTDASWRAVRQALETEKAVSIPATNQGMSLSVDWISEIYQDPIDGLAYTAEEGWETYAPKGLQAKGGEPVEVKQIILLTSLDDVKMRVGTQPLASYLHAIEGAVRDRFATVARAPGLDLLLQLEFAPEGAVHLKMASRPGIPDKILSRDLYHHLLTVPAPKVNEGPIKFEVLLAIWGGADTS